MRTKINQKKIALIIILLTLGVLCEGEKIFTFPDDYFKMPILRLDDSIVCVMDRGLLKGHIYDRKTLKKIAEFGGKGQGPSEFSGISWTVIDDNYIYVSSSPKLCIFSNKGKFIKEFRVPIKTSRFMPLRKNYVATYFVPSHPREKIVKNRYQLFDENLKLKKIFFTSEYHAFFQILNGQEIVYMFRDCEEAVVYKDKVYIGDSYKGIYFDVFDQNGDNLYEINLNEKQRILTSQKKEKIQEYYKTSGPPWKGKHPNRKLVIRDVIPAFQAFFVNDDRIYVFTYPKNREGYDIFILDLKGNILKKKKMSALEIFSVGTTFSYIHRGKLYFIKDSEGLFDSGSELHEIEIWGE
jgi:hypothetical protein